MTTPNLNPTERKVLAFLSETYSYEGLGFVGFAPIMSNTQLERKQVRRACRSLTRKGLAEYSRGLWSDEGKPGGAGYAATKAGAELFDTDD